MRGAQRVLVVDDSPEVCSIVELMMRNIGFHVTAATSSEAALHLFEEEGRNFDLLVIDIAMPGVLGVETADRLRRNRADLPVIFISGVADPDLLGLVVGGRARSAILAKPFESRDLEQAVRQLLRPGPPSGD